MAHLHAKLVKFPSIESPENVIPHLISAAQFLHHDKRTRELVYDRTLPLPSLTFRGTVKLHGANCAVVRTRQINGDLETHFQSRQKILNTSLADDYMGFARHMSKHKDFTDEMFKSIFFKRTKQRGKKVTADEISSISIYGEWCGGTIQKNIGISQFEKMFVVFAVKICYHPSRSRNKDDQQEWVDASLFRDLRKDSAHILSVYQFDTFEATIDLSSDRSIVDGLRVIEELTLGVQQECPVAKQLGASPALINGEGIVWHPVRVVYKLKDRSGSNLKLEKLASPGHWMKTRDIKPAPLSESLPPNEGPKKAAVIIGHPTKAAKRTLGKSKITFVWPDDDSRSVNSLSVKSLTADSFPIDSSSTKPVSTDPLCVDTPSATPLPVLSHPINSQDNGFLCINPLCVNILCEDPLCTGTGFIVESIPVDSTAANASSTDFFCVNPYCDEVFCIHPPPIDSPLNSLAVQSGPASFLNFLSISFSSIDSLVSFTTTDLRLEQGLQVLEREMKLPRNVRCIGPFIEWVVKDIFKEQSDRIERSGFNRKDVVSAIGSKATSYYLENLDVEWWVIKPEDHHLY